MQFTSDQEPEFETENFLESHVQFILDFYQNRVVDPNGGFFQTFTDTGEIYDPPVKHLVSSTRFVFNYATAFVRYGQPEHLEWADQGLRFLENRHKQDAGHYAWELYGDEVRDGRAMAYGHAFVILAAASALRAGINTAETILTNTVNFVDQYFWEDSHRAYADELDASLTVLDPYRGQNANMHMCEALIAAYQATGITRYLDRANTLAERFAQDLSTASNGLIWEHYTTEWQIDPEYNIDKPDDLFKPWGFQPGHQLEWSKLLMQLNSIDAKPWYLERAEYLFEQAMLKGWDEKHGGLVYGFAPDGQVCDGHKYFWVHAEGFAAAWRLYKYTGDNRYYEHYCNLWRWSWQHLIDHKHGAWFRIKHPDGSKFDELKSPPGKTDYHTLGACWDVLNVMKEHNDE